MTQSGLKTGQGAATNLGAQPQAWTTQQGKRFLAVGLPAAFTTLALFLGMKAAIHTDGYAATDLEPRTLVKIDVPVEKKLTIFSDIPAPEKLVAAQPPALPKQSPPNTVETLPLDYADWLPNTELNPDIIRTVVLTPAAHVDRTTQPIAPPILTYPRAAIDRELEGTCDVTFDVSLKGQPFNVRPLCTHSVFQCEAKRAIENVSFMPRIEDGQPVERHDVVYPIEFKLDDG